jgi:hypothetical protein
MHVCACMCALTYTPHFCLLTVLLLLGNLVGWLLFVFKLDLSKKIDRK